MPQPQEKRFVMIHGVTSDSVRERERQVMFVLQIKWVIFFVDIVVDKNRCETTD